MCSEPCDDGLVVCTRCVSFFVTLASRDSVVNILRPVPLLPRSADARPSVHKFTVHPLIYKSTHTTPDSEGRGIHSEPGMTDDLFEREAAAGVHIEHALQQIHGRLTGAGSAQVTAIPFDRAF